MWTKVVTQHVPTQNLLSLHYSFIQTSQKDLHQSELRVLLVYMNSKDKNTFFLLFVVVGCCWLLLLWWINLSCDLFLFLPCLSKHSLTYLPGFSIYRLNKKKKRRKKEKRKNRKTLSTKGVSVTLWPCHFTFKKVS
jgi:hypothetical protein